MTGTAAPPRRDETGLPSLRLLGFLLATACGLLFYAYRQLNDVTEGHHRPILYHLLSELIASYGAYLMFFGVRALHRRVRLTKAAWVSRLPFYLLALVVLSTMHTSWNWAIRTLIWPLAGLGSYHYGRMPLRYFMEFPIDVIAFWLFVAGLHIYESFNAARERELHAEQMERALAESRLRALRLQLQPHFLFNALNTISQTMFEDVRGADAMLTHLSELLRLSLRTSDTHVVPLSSELDALAHYAAIMRARFGERVQIVVDASDATRSALVPSFVLQPLVENAIRHGNATRQGRGRIEVTARQDGEALMLRVEDDGPGVPPNFRLNGEGIGLRATEDRLALLFGGDHGFDAGNGGHGFRVTIRVPFRTAGAGV